MNIIFQIDGGLGKSIMGTAMVKIMRKRYKNANLIVVTAYPDIFLNNPNINEVHRTDQTGGLYLKHIKDKNCKIFVADPYHHSNFILEKPISLYKTWCEIYGFTYNNEQPEIYLTQPEKDYFKPFYQLDKPILAIQPNGGPENIGYNYAWTRDIPRPTVLEVIEKYKDTHSIVHIKRKDQQMYPDTLQALDGFRSIAVLLQIADKRLLIDSFSQHMAAAFNLKSTVCWITTKPEIFGYKLHDNIKAEPFTKEPDLSKTVYNPFSLSQDISSIPYNDLNEVFNTQKILQSLNK